MSAGSTPASPENAADEPVEDEVTEDLDVASPDEHVGATPSEDGGPAVLEVPHDLGAALDSVVAERDELTHQLTEQRDSYARLAADFPAIEEVDLNPVFAYDEGTAPLAVDARLRVMPR